MKFLGVKLERTDRGTILATVTNQAIIRLAWGKRRVSSKAKNGIKAYQEEVSATLGVWFSWIKKIYDAKMCMSLLTKIVRDMEVATIKR